MVRVNAAVALRKDAGAIGRTEDESAAATGDGRSQ